jgi:hypothetical protein
LRIAGGKSCAGAVWTCCNRSKQNALDILVHVISRNTKSAGVCKTCKGIFGGWYLLEKSRETLLPKQRGCTLHSEMIQQRDTQNKTKTEVVT